MKTEYNGWYHLTDFEGTYKIEYFEKCPNGNFYGPFKTFGEAKRDALDYHQCNVRIARENIARLKFIKKGETHEIN